MKYGGREGRASRATVIERSLEGRSGPWLWSAFLLLPVLFLFAAHFWLQPAPKSPTGFIQYDQPGYMAMAREYFDDGFGLTYGLPFSESSATPRVYFQPWTLALGAVQRLTGGDPGVIYVVAGLVAALACMRVVIALYEDLFAYSSPGSQLGLVAFAWGGGALVLAGLLAGVAEGDVGTATLFRFDPADGWWFLNLGRNLVYTTEAYYHLLFLGTVLLLLRRGYRGAFLLCGLMSLSHPFTGIQLLLIVSLWGLAERFTFGNRYVPVWFAVAVPVLAAVHLAYYLWFLGAVSPEHRSLQEAWTLPWVLPWPAMVLAYGPVAALAAHRLSAGRGTRALSDASVRLLLIWLLVSLVLANHELFMEPHQPLHFTRGYIWTPLFLMGAPSLIGLLDRALGHRRALPGRVAAVALVGALLLDNTAFLATQIRAQVRGATVPFRITEDERRLFRVLSDERFDGYMVVSDVLQIGYLVTVYTPRRSWHSHHFSTPDGERRRRALAEFRGTRTPSPEWPAEQTVYALRSTRSQEEERGWIAAGTWTAEQVGPYLVLVQRGAAHRLDPDEGKGGWTQPSR